MNHDNYDTPDTPDLPDALRWQLRALREDEAPAADLWPGIAARLSARTDKAAPLAFASAPPVASRAAWLRRSRLPVALAASVLVAVGTLGLLRHGGPSADGRAHGTPTLAIAPEAAGATIAHHDANARGEPHVTADTPLALAEAEGLRLQYEGAFRELETQPGASAPNPSLRTLDQSAELILAALRQAPDSTRLLEQLRRTYQRRLDLMRLPLA
ncbi:hypothetical protein [Lysobacter olei]